MRRGFIPVDIAVVVIIVVVEAAIAASATKGSEAVVVGVRVLEFASICPLVVSNSISLCGLVIQGARVEEHILPYRQVPCWKNLQMAIVGGGP